MKSCRVILGIFIILILFFSCGKEKPPEEREYIPIEDLREKGEPPIETKTGINFSVYAPNAKYVSIVGDFNNWIENRHPMKKNRYGVWSITIPLKKGTYSYKFNVDGVWIPDPDNPEYVKDRLGDIRSIVHVKKRTPFYVEPIYKGFTNAFPPQITDKGVLFTYKDKYASKVSIAGTFNNWEADKYFLSKNQFGVWSIILPLDKGRYYYKFYVDGLWKEDPVNPLKEDDGMGGFRSIVEVPLDIKDRPSPPVIINYEIVRFEYKNKKLPSTINISVIGNFNNWDDTKLIMKDDDYDKVWFATVKLKEGEYYYLFKMMGEEFPDPSNPYLKTLPDGREVSYLQIKMPENRVKVKFTYYDPYAEKVYLVGDFNNWNPVADPMKKDEKGIWYITKDLKPGDYGYKYIVDGKWRLDPNNPDSVVNAVGDYLSYISIKF